MGFLNSFKGGIIFVVFADLTTAVRIDNERFALRGDDQSHGSAFVQSVATAQPGTKDAAPVDMDAFHAARHGRIKVLEDLYENDPRILNAKKTAGIDIGYTLAHEAVEGGHLDC